MKIHFNNKEIDILVDTSSYRYTALQNVGTLYLYFASEEFINIPVGAYCIYKNITYYLMDPDDFKKKSSRNFEYTLVMYDIGAILGKYKCRDIVSKRLKFDYTAKPHEHLQLIVDNLKAVGRLANVSKQKKRLLTTTISFVVRLCLLLPIRLRRSMK